jgi:hypothetical protein
MIMRDAFIAGLTAILVLVTGASRPEAALAQSLLRKQPPRVIVEGRATARITGDQQSITLTLTATPVPGVHVYAPGNPKYIAVSVIVLPVAGLAIGAPVFPDGEPYFFAPLKEAVSVYSKPFVVTVPMKVTPAFMKGRARGSDDKVVVKGTLNYQACDDRVCFPPQSQPFAVDVPVKLARR